MDDSLRLVARAADFAARAHRAQRRKDADQTPYINHLTEVARLLADAGCEPQVVAAGYLHDAVEDVGVTAETIAAEFGQRVADLVLAVTDDKTLTKAERKLKQVERAAHAGPDAGALKLADKISNLNSLRDHPPAGWPDSRIVEYVEWAHRVVSSLPQPNRALLSQFQEARSHLLALKSAGAPE